MPQMFNHNGRWMTHDQFVKARYGDPKEEEKSLKKKNTKEAVPDKTQEVSPKESATEVKPNKPARKSNKK